MSTVLEPERVLDVRDEVSVARRRRRREPRAGALAGSLRFAAFAALVLYGCQHWVRQVAPTPRGVALQMAAVGIALAVALLLAGRLQPGRPRRAVIAAACVVGGVLALAAAGIPLRFLGWRNWGELGPGVREGVASLPNLNIPYRGLDEWVRWIILSGAALLGVIAAALAFAGGPAGPGERRRRTVAAALVLGVLYGVPVVERNPDSPFLSGAGFAVLLALFLGADRLTATRGARPRLVAAAAGLGALAVAALAAPQLDAAKPWVDYRGLAGDLGERGQTAFDWNHSYSPLDWPRDGKEILRVKAKQAAYWKATALRRFDGVRWVRQPVGAAEEAAFVDTPRPPEPEWYEDIEVTVRGLRSEEYLTAGFTSEITGVPRPAQPAGSGTYRTNGRPLRSGDTYTAKTYTPRPTPAQLRAAGTDYPPYTQQEDLSLELPERVGGPAPVPGGRGPEETTIVFSDFGTESPALAFVAGTTSPVDAGPLLEASGYARTWELAQRLRDQATSPLDLVRDVRVRVQRDARYTERPEQGRIPLDAFLFDTRAGYCQQFSGAMALLLRMAGVPARVASGFTAGSFDTDRGQYIVRDLDAHSWVEAFFPGIGWVTFDPTPSVAPPASQTAGDGGDSTADTDTAEGQARADVAEPAPATPAAQEGGGAGGGGDAGAPVGLLVLGGLLLALAAGAAAWWRRPRTPLSPLEELRRALSRSGRPAENALTLQALERSLAGTPAAQGYVRKLREARYAGREEPATREERAALRDELAAGLGLRGRLRALWALPPRLPARG